MPSPVRNPGYPGDAWMTRGALLAALAFVSSACADGDAPPVAPPGDLRTPLDVVFCRRTAPQWVAFQDGDGTWSRAQPIADGPRVRFHHDFSANRGAVATTRALVSPASTALEIQYGAVAELAAVGDTTSTPCADAGLVTLSGSVAGLQTNDVAVVTAGFTSRETLLPSSEGFKLTLRGPPAPPQDILATRARIAGDNVTVTGFILRRAVAARDTDTLPVFDFDSPEAFMPTIRNLTITGLGPDDFIAFTGLRTAHSVSVVLPVTSDDATAMRPYYAVPASHLAAGDVQFLTARAASASTGVLRRATAYFRAPIDVTLAFGGEVVPPEVSVVASEPTLRLRAHFAPQGNYDRLTTITYRAQGAVVSVAMTDAYARLSGNGYDLVVPELTGVPGFDPRWALRGGSGVNWSVVLIGGTLGLGLDAVPTDGATQLAAELAGLMPARSVSPP